MKIRVLKKDIDMGRPHSAQRCPIARALRRAGFKNVMVFSGGFSNNGTVRVKYKFPDIVNLFIERFDHDWTVKPFTFTLPDTILKSR